MSSTENFRVHILFVSKMYLPGTFLILLSILGKMTREREKHSVSNFQEDWLTDERYKIWIRKEPNKPQKA